MRMPKRRELSPHASTQELEHRYSKARNCVERSHHQIVWLLSEGKSTREVCEVTGYSPGWVHKIARRYNERGVEGLGGDRRHQNPGAKERALLDEAAEAELLEALQGLPPGGGMWSGPKVARWMAQRNGLQKVHVQRGSLSTSGRSDTALRFQGPKMPQPTPPSRRLSKKSFRASEGHWRGPSGGRGGALGRRRG